MHMLTHYLTGIYLFSRIDEELSAILQFVKCIGISSTCLKSNHRTVQTTGDITLVRLVFLIAMSHDSFSL